MPIQTLICCALYGIGFYAFIAGFIWGWPAALAGLLAMVIGLVALAFRPNDKT